MPHLSAQCCPWNCLSGLTLPTSLCPQPSRAGPCRMCWTTGRASRKQTSCLSSRSHAGCQPGKRQPGSPPSHQAQKCRHHLLGPDQIQCRAACRSPGSHPQRPPWPQPHFRQLKRRPEVLGGVEIGMQRTLGETGGEEHYLLRENCSPATAGPIHHTQTGSSDFSIPGGVQARPEAGGTPRSSLHPAVRTPHQASSLHRAPKATPSCSWGTITVAVWPRSPSSPPHLPLR